MADKEIQREIEGNVSNFEMSTNKVKTEILKSYYIFRIDDELKIEMSSKDYNQLQDIKVNATKCKIIVMNNHKAKKYFLIVPESLFEIEVRKNNEE